MEKFLMAGDCALHINDCYVKPDTQNGQNDMIAEMPVVVLLHGYLESLEVWDDFIPLLIPPMRVVSVDLPGHGISEIKGETHSMEFLADTVKNALDALDIEKCFLVGHSMGGYAGLEFLRKYPERLHGFVLFHSTPDPDNEEKKQHRLREIGIIDAGRKILISNSIQYAFAEDNRGRLRDVIEDFKERVAITEDEGIKALLRGMMERGDSNEVLKKSSVPELFIFGRKDEYIKPEDAETIEVNHPQAKTVWLENSGHTGFIEEPEASAKAILDFCRDTLPSIPR